MDDHGTFTIGVLVHNLLMNKNQNLMVELLNIGVNMTEGKLDSKYKKIQHHFKAPSLCYEIKLFDF